MSRTFAGSFFSVYTRSSDPARSSICERIKPDAQIAIERFDDISFEKHGTPAELIQLKHHLGAAPDLGDKSPDLWKTLRVWSAFVATPGTSPSSTIFTIITTAKCTADGAAYYLRPGDKRDVTKAHKLLLNAATTMKGDTLKPAREAFLALSHAKQRALLDSVRVIDQTPTIIDVVADIRKLLGFPVPLARLSVFVERLEGWWFSQVTARMSGDNPSSISAVSLGLQIDDLRASFSADSLPIDFRGQAPSEAELQADRVFITQLRLIGIDDKNIHHARVDFFRAFSQRSKWLKDDLLNLTQLGDYDRVLKEEWERERDWINRDATQNDDEMVMVERGISLYRLLQTQCRPIRPNCTEPYVGRGSYQLLADRKLVGWHRDYLHRLEPAPLASTIADRERGNDALE